MLPQTTFNFQPKVDYFRYHLSQAGVSTVQGIPTALVDRSRAAYNRRFSDIWAEEYILIFLSLSASVPADESRMNSRI